jgi:hypothetical protein
MSETSRQTAQRFGKGVQALLAQMCAYAGRAQMWAFAMDRRCPRARAERRCARAPDRGIARRPERKANSDIALRSEEP